MSESPDLSSRLPANPLRRALPVLDRREFLARSTLLSLGAIVAAACGGSTDSPTGPGTVNLTVSPTDYAALSAVGGIARLSGTTTPIALVRASASGYRAFWLVCPHAGTTVAVNGAGFRCPNHGATFSSTGAWTGGQRTSGLREFTVTPDAATGTLTITA